MTPVFGYIKNSPQGYGIIMTAKKRLKRLTNLEKAVTDKTNLSERKLRKIKEVELEAEEKLKRLDLHLPLKKIGKIVYIPRTLKEIISYARKTELKYKDYIGTIPEFFIGNE